MQWITKNGWDDEIGRNFHIGSIPRFILIDQEGVIVNPNAPRPSEHDELAALFDEQIAKLGAE